MSKVVCIGESLIDFMPTGEDLTFAAKAGGAPSNVCACIAKLGGVGCYLGKLSEDIFSRFLLANMKKWGVNTDYTIIDKRYQTALAFVSHDENGDREFNFYRNQSCDLLLDKSEIPNDLFEKGDILHFCSVGLVESPSKCAHKRAIELAKANDCIVSFDVNVRERLWDNIENCVSTIKEFLSVADIVKVTDDELVLLTGENNEEVAVKQLFDLAKQSKLLIVTKGGSGASVYDRTGNTYFSAAADVNVVDTTGAGDCFIGCVLYKLNCGEANLTLDGIKQAMDFASLGCGVVIGKKGAIESMPTQEDIKKLKISLK